MNLQIRPALTLFVVLSLVTGVLYPLAVTGIAQLAFAESADGSLVVRDGKVVGSSLIGQPFSDPKHFWSRPSATSPMPYHAANSAGSNLGPSNRALHDAVAARVQALRAADPGHAMPVPVDLVTASGSGLDPHISRAAADWQVERVARARSLAPARVQELVERHSEAVLFGLIGEPRVNVLMLNLALDAMTPAP